MASENQACPSSKPRSMLPRTLLIFLSPISDGSSTKYRRCNSKKIEKAFEDFKQCNKQSLSVQLQDAVDDIHLVGWISPYTLLIHGSKEDMDTIEHAWVGRMLKSPREFIIKGFGEISELKMKQISQSQFLSICDTLCAIVKGLNDNSIAATFECIVSRLLSSFDRVVIPPKTAIKRSLDLLVRELRLDFSNGSYYFKSTTPVYNNMNVSRPKEQQLPTTFHTRKSKQEKKEEAKLRKGEKHVARGGKRKRKNSRKLRNNLEKSRSPRMTKTNPSIPRRHYSYEELTSPSKLRDLKYKKQIHKRNSFLGKLSRLLRIGSEDETSNDEVDDNSDDICYGGGWDDILNDDHARLLLDKARVKPKLKKSRQRKKNINASKKPTDVAGDKQISRIRHSEISRRISTYERANLDRNQLANNKSARGPSGTFRSRDEASLVPTRKIAAAQQAGWTYSQKRKNNTHSQYSSSSESASDLSNDSYDSASSESNANFQRSRKSFYCSEDETTDEEPSEEPYGVSYFCSTQAVCGDLEPLSTLSINKTTSFSDSSNMMKTKFLETPLVLTDENEQLHNDCQQSSIPCDRNLVHLIGIL